MATGASIKMGVTGVSQFKQEISRLTNSMSTLDEALKLNAAELKKTGDAEDKLKERAELLKTKLAEQKGVVETAEAALKQMNEQGVDKSSKAFQDMQKKVLKAKTAIVQTETEIDGLTTSEVKAEESTDSLNTKLGELGTHVSLKSVTEGIDNITGAMEKAAKKALKLGKALVKNVLGAGSWADDIKTTAAKLGLDPEELQRMQQTADVIDTDVEAIAKARQKLMKGVGNGNKGTMDTLEALGISGEGNAEDIFWAAGEAIMKLGDEAEQEAKANDLFGKSWRDLIPLFTAGREEYEKYNETWSVVSNEQLDSLGKMDDEYQKLQNQFETLKKTALAEFAEPMTAAMEALNGLMADFTGWLQSEEGRAAVNNVVTIVKDAMQFIIDNKEGVIAALGAIVTGWGMLKLTGGALKILDMINGLKELGLLGGKAAAGAAGSAGAGGAAGGGWLAGAAGTVKSLIAANGASLLAPFAALFAGIAPALIANQSTFNNAEAKREERMGNANKLAEGEAKQFLTAAADALGYQRNANGEIDRNFIGAAQLGNYSEIESLLMGMGSRSDLEKSKLHNMLSGLSNSWNKNDAWNELQALWSGEGDFDMGRLTGLLETVTDAYDKMAAQTEQLTGASETQTNSNSEMTQAANNLESLPDKMAAAVSKVQLNVNVNPNAFTPYINRAMGALMASM